jgi:hypothetical protein
LNVADRVYLLPSNAFLTLQAMESKLLHGGGNVLKKTTEQVGVIEYLTMFNHLSGF